MDQIAFNIQATAATDSIRTETFNGDEYVVVPVVALVEGVLHSANAEHPELALASEFGRYPNAWDGRPLVMNHPKVDDAYVGANSPTVLEEWSFGQLFNTRLDGDKLKTEAWINTAKVNALGGEAASTLERIQSGDMVEVSTGLFAMVDESESGKHNGIDYAGVWHSVAPDHLAFLSEGTIGACSVEAGAGVPRLNMLRRMPIKSNVEETTVDHTDVQRIQKANSAFDHLIENSFPTDMPIENVRILLQDALEADSIVIGAGGLWNIWAFTQDSVVYETWNSADKFQRPFTTNESTVTLGDEVTTVNLLTAIVPKTNLNEIEEDIVMDSAIEVTPEGNTVATPTEVVEDVTATPTPTAPAAEVVTNSAPASVEDYIASAPSEMREVLVNSLKIHNDTKAGIVKSLMANEQNAFTEETLNGMDLSTLENLAALASPVANNAPQAPNYSGQAPRTQAQIDDQNSVPAVLEAFPREAKSA